MAWPTNPRPAKALLTLIDRVNTLAPNRSKDSDGMLGDAKHQSGTSDHNPNASGVVTACDITHDSKHGLDSYALAEQLLAHQDTRIKYVISNRKIASGTGQGHPAWKWRKYTGSNPHDAHVHVSLKGDAAHYDSMAAWALDGVPVSDTGPPVIAKPTLKIGSKGADVRDLQTKLFVDGDYGPATAAAVKAWQRAHGLTPDGVVGPYTWRALYPTAAAPPAAGDLTWITDITATEFGGPHDVNHSAYDNHIIGTTEKVVALPYRFTGSRPTVEVRVGDHVEEATIDDIGPWNINDPYWQTGTRPQAESGTDTTGRRTNKAGIDLSPALAKAMGIAGKGLVDWRFKRTPAIDAPTAEAPVPATFAVEVTPPIEVVPPIEMVAPPVVAPAPMAAPLPKKIPMKQHDQLWTMVRYGLVAGGTLLATYGYMKPEDVPGLVDQVMPAIEGVVTAVGAVIAAAGALWGLYVGQKTARVPVETLTADSVVVNPASGKTEQLGTQ